MPAAGCPTSTQINDAIQAYVDGHVRLMAAAKMIGVSTGRFKEFMAERGVQVRTRSQAQAMRHVRDADTPWKARFQEAARKSTREWVYSEANRVRMSRLGSETGTRNAGRVPSLTSRERRAASHQREGLKVSPVALQLNNMLRERGLDTVMEQAFGPYNIDIAVAPVAVEVHRYSWDPFGRTGVKLLLQRAKYLGNRGWAALYVWVSPKANLVTAEAADDVLAYVQATQRNPALIGQYRVIRGTGQLVSVGRLDCDDLP